MGKFFKMILGCLVVLGWSVPAFCAGSFQGIVSYEMTSGDKTTNLDYYIKGHKVRLIMKINGKDQASIVDWDAMKIYVLMDKNKMYMTTDMPNPEKISADKNGKFSDTGETEKILGHTCEKYIYTRDNWNTETWLAKGMGYFSSSVSGQNGSEASWLQLAKAKGLFPLKSITKDKDGKIKSTMTATQVQAQSLADSLFQVPQGYKSMNLPKIDMGQTLGNSVQPKIPGF